MGALHDVLRLIPLFALPGKHRARAIYDLLGTRARLGERSLYLNLGYWEHAKTFDDAGDALAHMLAQAAGMRSGCDVLDVGVGFADQDLLWARTHAPRRIVGLNITPSQLAVARQRVIEAEQTPCIKFALASATRLPFPDANFDCVTALESAFHFPTREDFLREAQRVLRPGGRVALADIIPRQGRLALRDRLAWSLARSFWQMPRANIYDATEYRRILERVGFARIEIRSIREQVFPPFAQWARRWLEDRGRSRPLGAMLRGVWLSALRRDRFLDGFDYVLVSGAKG